MPQNSSKIRSIFPEPQSGAPDILVRLIGLAFSALWLGLAGLYAFAGWRPEGPFGPAVLGLVAGLPVLMAWVLVGTIVSIRRLNAQTAGLRKTIDGLRAAQSRLPVARKAPPVAVDAGSSPQTQTTNGKRLQAEGDSQPALALGPLMGTPAAPLAVADLLRALHFPDGPEDTEGFRALRLALADHGTAKLIRSAQDVLTLLAQDGIFMDTLAAAPPNPEIWRKFARGERGGIVASLGDLRDQRCLELTAARMRKDAVFRDAALHFLNSFDKALIALEPRASDADLALVSDTRSARAFMLLGRVTGTFDATSLS
jgi:hypothetical protein